MKLGDILEVEVDSLGYGGIGIYKKSKFVIFIPGVLPSDIVKIKITKLKKNYGKAEVLKLIKASPFRVDSGCKAFQDGCGGCQWLDFSYSEQLKWKMRIVKETLKYLGGVQTKILPVIGMNKPYFYRNKLSLQYNEGRLGFMKWKSHKIIQFDLCRQEMEYNQKAYDLIKKYEIPKSIEQVHIRSNTLNETSVCFMCNRSSNRIKQFGELIARKNYFIKGIGVASYNKFDLLSGNDNIRQNINGIDYQIPLNSFFQVNYEQAAKLQKIVKEFLHPEPKDEIIDLYCGVGFFTLDIAKAASYIYGIDNNYNSVQEAIRNSKINKIKNAHFIYNEVRKGLFEFKPNSIKSMILDPSRNGCEDGVINEIKRIKPKKIVYVSCAPDTIARDLSMLSNFGYKIEKCQPVDMFPHTYHIEMVVELKI